jgi:transglutaminase-like putative cysteine protease
MAALTLALGTAAAGEPAEDSTGASREFRLTYRTRVPHPAGSGRRVEVWVPLPASLPVQEVVSLTVSAPVPYETTVEPVHGNRMVHLVAQDSPGDIAIEWTAVVRRWVEEGQEPGVASVVHLSGDRLAPVDDRARSIAKEIGADDPALSPRERARRIFDHVVAATEYDKTVPGWGTGDFDRVVRVNKGNCSDFTARFVTLARATGLPSRWVSSIALSEDHAACDACGYHCYAHFLEDGRWVPVDPSDARRAKDPAVAEWHFGHAARHHVILSVGRDIVLAPAQKGAAINHFAAPYVEVDGVETPLDEKDRSYHAEALPEEPASPP